MKISDSKQRNEWTKRKRRAIVNKNSGRKKQKKEQEKMLLIKFKDCISFISFTFDPMEFLNFPKVKDFLINFYDEDVLNWKYLLIMHFEKKIFVWSSSSSIIIFYK